MLSDSFFMYRSVACAPLGIACVCVCVCAQCVQVFLTVYSTEHVFTSLSLGAHACVCTSKGRDACVSSLPQCTCITDTMSVWLISSEPHLHVFLIRRYP